MEQLKKRFESTLAQLDRLREKVGEGTFLSEDDQAALQEALSGLMEEQSRVQGMLEDAGPAGSLQQAQALLERRAEDGARRQVVEDFKRLRCLEETFQNELSEHLSRLQALDGAALRELDASGGLEPYRAFLACVRLEHPGYEDVAPLIATFGTALPLGIMGGKIVLSGEGPVQKDAPLPLTASLPKGAPIPEPVVIPEPVPISKLAGLSGKKPAARSAAKSKSTEKPAAKSAAESVSKSAPEPTPKSASKPASKSEPVSSKTNNVLEHFKKVMETSPTLSLPLKTDLAQLGTLETTGSRKQPKGVKALSSMCASSPDIFLMVYELLSSQYIILPQCPIFHAFDHDLDLERRLRCLNTLVREGYLVRYALDDDRVLYRATEEGAGTLHKFISKTKRAAKFLGRIPPAEYAAAPFHAAAFLRCYEGRRWFSRTFDLSAPGRKSTILGNFAEYGTFSTVSVSLTADSPVKAVIFPALLYVEEDDQMDFFTFFENLEDSSITYEPGCKLFLATVPGADREAWKTCLLDELPDGLDPEIYWADIGSDIYYHDETHEALDLDAYLRELAGEDGHEHRPGEPVREVLQEATCTQKGRYAEVVRCEDCGEELSREEHSLPKLPHEPAPEQEEVIAAPTCAREGKLERVIRCKVCGAELSRRTEVLPKTEHVPGKTVRKVLTKPTCTREGQYEERLCCRDCGVLLSTTTGPVPKTEHVPGPPVRENIKEPTATETGSYEEAVFCTGCGQELSRRVRTIPALGTLEENQLAQARRQMHQLFIEEKFPSALTMARALKARRQEYLQYAYALDDPACPKRYTYSELQTVFSSGFGQTLAEDALGLAAYLRLFFSSDAAVESYYLGDIMTTLDRNGMFERFPELKNVVYDLSSCYNRTHRVLDPETLSMLVDNKRTSTLRVRYQRGAKVFLAGKPDESQQLNKRVNGTFKALFGLKSPLRSALEWVCAGDEEKVEAVRETFAPFLKEPVTGVCEDKHLDKDAIERYVDEVWDTTKDRVANKRNENFRDPARSTALNRFWELTKLAVSWAALSGGGQGVEEADRSFLDNQRRKIAGQMESAAEVCGNFQAERLEDLAALRVLAAALRKLSGLLRDGGEVNEGKYFYLEFLRDNRIEVDENGIPCLEEEFSEISPLNICKRVAKHSTAELPDWPEVLKRIFEDADEGCDFGHAELIRSYLLASGEEFVWPENYSFERSIEAALQRMDEEARKFQAQLDLAENYGWIDDTGRVDHILADMEKRREHYLSTQNFGFYFRTCEAYKMSLRREAERHKAGYAAELARLRAELGPWPIFDEAERLISEQMYTVAQDYMDQARTTGQQEAPTSTYLAQKDDAFSTYLRQYDRLLTSAREASERKISEVYARRSRSLDRGVARSGERLVNHWPRSVSAGMPENLKELFEAMGLAVARVEPQEHDRHYKVQFLRRGREVNYPHPIGAYGTVMQENGLHVFLTFGKRNDSAMNAELQRIMSAPLAQQEPAIVLADTAIPLPERRSLAHKLKSQSKTSPYLLLDRVLLFYLAEFRQEERWNVLLRCTLPFHAYNPYTESSTVELCPEMFIGRQRELDSIVDSGGANIVYGGRQLGKTALLQRARNLRNSREDGQWAFYLDIRNRSVSGTARLIYEMLLDDGFLSEPGGVEVEDISWDRLTRKIIQRMTREDQPVKSVLLLLDEADAFLRGCGEDGYEPIVSLKRIQSRTNRFKFVLAGLHNVMRFSKRTAQSDDSPIPHLASITMRPLPFHEARELIELPLSFLGFKVRPENDYLIVQILSSTNYFPGLIQYYCSSLVNTANQNYRGDANERPPYWLEEAQILTLLKDKKFRANIKDKYEITLGVDEGEKGYYKTLAYALARCYFDHPENLASGYTAEDIRSVCAGLDIHSIMDLDQEQMAGLLDELIDLNVLRSRPDGAETRYIFNRASFRHMLGGEQEVDDELWKIMEKEADAHV